MLRSVPIRIRLALGFALVMAVVLGATGIFVYERTRSDLDRQIDRELDARLAGVIAILRDDGDDLGDPRHLPLSRVDAEGIVQVLGPSGDVLEETASQLGGVPIVTSSEADALVAGQVESVDVQIAGEVGDLRVVAARTVDDGVQYVALVGASLDSREAALSSLSRLLLIGGPLALFLASLAGYGVATAALRPVDAMRRRAAEIGDHERESRLPVGPARDEIAELGKTLNGMLDRLEDAFERERRFVADASHELRTPLSILRGEVELAMNEGRSEAELREALASVGEETERLTRLAEDLLVLARADQGRLPVRSETLSAKALGDRVAARFATRAPGRIAVGVPQDLTLEGDPLRLEQALYNLVDNALRYGEGEVRIEAARTDGGVEFHVRDQGDGFAPEFAGLAMERFTRGESGRANGGAGLGLSLVDAIARAHGGAAGITAGDDGADVWLRIP